MLFSKKSCVPEKLLCRNLVKDCFQFTTKNEKKQKQKQKESKKTKTDKNIKKQQRKKNEASLEI